MTVALLSDCLLISSPKSSQNKRAVNLQTRVLKFCSEAFNLRTFRHYVSISLLLHENVKNKVSIFKFARNYSIQTAITLLQ